MNPQKVLSRTSFAGDVATQDSGGDDGNRTRTISLEVWLGQFAFAQVRRDFLCLWRPARDLTGPYFTHTDNTS